MDRKLASIRTVSGVSKVENSDNLDVIQIDGWKVVATRNEFKPGDKCVYFEIDSFLPEREQFEFLRKSCHRVHPVEDRPGFRLRTIKLRGQISQGLAIHVPPELSGCQIGDDVTTELGVVKWEIPIPACIAGDIYGAFPNYIRKTDEERIQNIDNYQHLQTLSNWVIREKLDGSSTTFYRHLNHFGVCSRNWELKDSETQSAWVFAREHILERKLPEGFALQGELVGPGVQGNPYRLKKLEVRFFSLFDIEGNKYEPTSVLDALCLDIGLNTVPHIGILKSLPSIEDMLVMADGKSELNPVTDREGIVCRAENDSEVIQSFKVVSNIFLAKEK